MDFLHLTVMYSIYTRIGFLSQYGPKGMDLLLSPLLEHNLFKNVPEESLFCDKHKLKHLNMVLMNVIRIKKKQVISILYSFTPSNMNFIWF